MSDQPGHKLSRFSQGVYVAPFLPYHNHPPVAQRTHLSDYGSTRRNPYVCSGCKLALVSDTMRYP